MPEDVKLLSKMFLILEYVLRQNGRPVLPSELLTCFPVSQPTCVRILRALTNMGYLAQRERRKGYAAGPLAFWAARFADPYAGLRNVAMPFVEKCACASKTGVLLAVRHRDFRYIVGGCNGNPAFELDLDSPRFYDLFKTASGRLLLAYAPDADRAEILRANPEPDYGDMPHFATLEALEADLADIRARGWNEGFYLGRGSAAYPVFADGVCVAAIAAAWLDDGRTDVCAVRAGLCRAAEQIGGKLSRTVITG